MTADEYINKHGYATWFTETGENEGEVVINSEDCKEAMIEFAKFHVKAALQAVDDEMEYRGVQISPKQVFNLYPLENIK